MRLDRVRSLVALSLALTSPAIAGGQGTAADYARSEQIAQRLQGLVTGVADRPVWIDSTSRFWYRVSVKGGNQFVLVDAVAKTKAPAFDHARLATALSAAASQSYTALTLPMTAIDLDTAGVVSFAAAGFNWRCTLTDYSLREQGRCRSGRRGRAWWTRWRWARRRTGEAVVVAAARRQSLTNVMPRSNHRSTSSAKPYRSRVRGTSTRRPRPSRHLRRSANASCPMTNDTLPCYSPDYTLEAFIRNFNIFIRPAPANARATAERAASGAGGRGAAGGRGGGGGGRAGGAGGRAGAPVNAGAQLSWDGSEGSAYSRGQMRWSPDSRKIAAYRVTPGYQRMVRYVLSSPVDQLQPSYAERYYQKPGDVVTLREPALFDVASKKEFKIDNALFPNAYNLSQIQWWQDSRAFTFEYNQRGHQVYRVIEVDANTGTPRVLIDEQSKTFIDYSATSDALSSGGRRYRRDLADGKEILWLSERDGWSHLYLYDGITGRVKNQVTKGNWRVQNVQLVDTLKRQVWFSATAINPAQDPYFIHFYRINFDGTGLTAYTKEDGTHTVSWSANSEFYTDRWERVDLPPVTVLKRASDQSVVLELEKGDASALLAAGYKNTEIFVSKARDGVTDIWGIIIKPTNFDPAKKYPVIEQIYAGPQGSFVPKTWSTAGATRTLAELGFIVVQIDGMGTTNRSRAFHDVAWQDLGDAGFPDRILWHKAVAAKYPWYDVSRVGIYGTSAGGQNALGGLLFHPEFYKVGFAAAGCHDNRMDKIWWNEQWMGWPLGPHYAASSNVDNAYKLQGKLMLYVGEYDTNVDPASTMQVVGALIRANKMFDLIVQPGADHGNGGAYGVRKMTDFFVHNLIGVEPPDRNAGAPPAPSGRGG